MGSFLGGRSDRWEYWTSVALLTAAGLILPMLHVYAAPAALLVMWIVTWARRLHDINYSAWVVLVPGGVMAALVLGGFLLGGHDFANTLIASQRRGTTSPTPGLYLLAGIVLASLLVQYGFSIWLGLKSGDPRENRFGPPHDGSAIKAGK